MFAAVLRCASALLGFESVGELMSQLDPFLTPVVED